MRRSYKILAIGAGMEGFILFSLLVHHLLFSNESDMPYSPLYNIWGNSIHPVLFGGIVVLLAGAIVHYTDRKKDQKL